MAKATTRPKSHGYREKITTGTVRMKLQGTICLRARERATTSRSRWKLHCVLMFCTIIGLCDCAQQTTFRRRLVHGVVLEKDKHNLCIFWRAFKRKTREMRWFKNNKHCWLPHCSYMVSKTYRLVFAELYVGFPSSLLLICIFFVVLKARYTELLFWNWAPINKYTALFYHC